MTCKVPYEEGGTLKDTTLLDADIINPKITNPEIVGGGSLDEATAEAFVRDMIKPLGDAISEILATHWLEGLQLRDPTIEGEISLDTTAGDSIYQQIKDLIGSQVDEQIGDALLQELSLTLKSLDLVGHVTVGEDAATDIYSSILQKISGQIAEEVEPIISDALKETLSLTLSGVKLQDGATLDAATVASIFDALSEKIGDKISADVAAMIDAALTEELKLTLDDSTFIGRVTLSELSAKDVYDQIKELISVDTTGTVEDAIKEILRGELKGLKLSKPTITDAVWSGHVSLDATALLDLSNALTPSLYEALLKKVEEIILPTIKLEARDYVDGVISDALKGLINTLTECTIPNLLGRILTDIREEDLEDRVIHTVTSTDFRLNKDDEHYQTEHEIIVPNYYDKNGDKIPAGTPLARVEDLTAGGGRIISATFDGLLGAGLDVPNTMLIPTPPKELPGGITIQVLSVDVQIDTSLNLNQNGVWGANLQIFGVSLEGGVAVTENFGVLPRIQVAPVSQTTISIPPGEKDVAISALQSGASFARVLVTYLVQGVDDSVELTAPAYPIPPYEGSEDYPVSKFTSPLSVDKVLVKGDVLLEGSPVNISEWGRGTVVEVPHDLAQDFYEKVTEGIYYGQKVTMELNEEMSKMLDGETNLRTSQEILQPAKDYFPQVVAAFAAI